MKPIDLRSDTVTRPTLAMRHAMFEAAVGDDVYGEDPTVCALQERVADLLGKESALFVMSGTLANQLAILVQARPGDEVIVPEGAHCLWYESGAAAALAGVQLVVAGEGVQYSPEALEAAVKPTAYFYPRTRLATFENTHNRGGGRVLDHAAVVATADRARALGLGLHLDGARLCNAAVATGLSLRTLAAPFDTVSLCLSKGLGAPVGSLLAGPKALITEAHRLRKRLGGGLRQIGMLAAAGLHALDHHVARLADDHEHAQLFAHRVAAEPRLRVETPQTNIVMINLDTPSAERFVAAADKRGVKASVFGPARVRVVTHLDVTREEVRQAAEVFLELAAEGL